MCKELKSSNDIIITCHAAPHVYKLTVVSLLTTSMECSDISMFTKTEKYLPDNKKIHRW